MRILFIFLLLLALRSEAAEPLTQKGMIDLGSGEVESDIQGSQYLLRIRGSLEDRIKDLESAFDQQSFKEVEARNLKLALGVKKSGL